MYNTRINAKNEDQTMRAEEISFEAVLNKRKTVDCENQDERREAWRMY